jgi:hypothetical protein
MTYDQDLRMSRWMTGLLTLANLGAAILHGLERHWLYMATSLVWACSSGFYSRCIHYQQLMRDSLRVAQAGIRAFHEQYEDDDKL